MFRSENYQPQPAEVEEFVASMRHGYLIAAPAGGFPTTSTLPFLKSADEIELHCVQADPTFAALQANPRVTFLVSDFLAASPHHWVDPNDAGRATLHFRAVQYSCDATWSSDRAVVAAALARLVSAYDGQGEHRLIAANDFYGPRLSRLAALRLRVVSTDAKFKVGPAGRAELKLRVAERLRERAAPGDARAADIIEARVAATAR